MTPWPAPASITYSETAEFPVETGLRDCDIVGAAIAALLQWA